jgi:hypothetical protein
MKSGNSKLLMILTSLFLLTACATTTKVDNLDSAYNAKEKDCEIRFYNDEKPNNPYEVIGKIESHIEKNLFFGGKAKLEDEAYKELRLKACGLGGDAVIIDDSIETSAAETSHVHVWATVIKLSN